MKKVRILKNFGNWKLEDFLVTSILLELCDIEEVQDNEDLLIHSVFKGKFDTNKKTLLVSGEPLFLEINYLQVLLTSKYFRKIFKYFHRIVPLFILNIKFGYLRGWYVNLLSEIKQDKHKNIYAIICNDTKADNIFNIPYFILQLYVATKGFNGFQLRKKIDQIPKKFCCAVVSNSFCLERNDFYRKLSKYKKIDIYGRHFLNNSDNTKISKYSDFSNHKLFKEYKFVVCFENSFTPEYITNKIVEPMMGNSIPIYRGGDGDIGNYFNTRSFINYDNYRSHKKMIDKIIELDNDDKKYRSFLEQPWMTQENMAYIEEKKQGLKKFLERMVEDL